MSLGPRTFNSDQKKLVNIDLYSLQLKATLWLMSFLQKNAAVMPPVKNPHQAATFSCFIERSFNSYGLVSFQMH